MKAFGLKPILRVVRAEPPINAAFQSVAKHWLPTMLQSEFIRELHQAAATGDPDLSPDASRKVLSLKAGKA